jgi:hypothetical protein
MPMGYLAKVEIEGTGLYLVNRFLNPGKIGGPTGGKKSVAQEIKEAPQKCHYNEKGIIACPALSLKSSLVGAAGLSSLKYGKKSIVPFMRAWLFIEPDMIPFEPNRKVPDFIDSRIATNRNMGKGTAVLVHRPGLNEGWILHFNIRVMDDRLPQEHVLTALKEAGTMTGIGSYRPEFGRFKVNSFEIT